jgi:hypothetical protein
VAFYLAAVNLAPFDINTMPEVTAVFLKENGMTEAMYEMLMGYYMVWFFGAATRQVPVDRETVAMFLNLHGISEEKQAIIIGGLGILIGFAGAEAAKVLMDQK